MPDNFSQQMVHWQGFFLLFFNILILALLFDIPDWPANGIGKATTVVGGLSIVRVTVMLVNQIRTGGAKPLGRQVFSRPYEVFLFRQSAFPLLAYGFVFLGGVRLTLGIIDGIYIVAGLTVALLIGAGPL